MSNNKHIVHPLIRDGISQWERKSAALQDSYVSMDERKPEELLSFLYRYARYVLYYEAPPAENNSDILMPAGDWQDFFRNNAPFQYAIIHEFPVASLKNAYDKARKGYESGFDAGQLWPVINQVLAVMLQLNSWYRSLYDPAQTNVNDQTLYRILDALIRTDFSKGLHRLIALTNTIEAGAEASASRLFSINPLKENDAWGLTIDKLVSSDQELNRLGSYPRRQHMKALTTLDELFNIGYNGVLQLQTAAADNFSKALSGGDMKKHPPHLGLLYAFLKLFDNVKTEMNRFTGKHLDFFYREILQLKARPAQPDHVHVLVALAQQVHSRLMPAGTAFKAGKDKTGKDLSFAMEKEVVFNEAVVAQLRTLYKDERSTLFTASVANSADGAGAPFQDETNNSWPLLGNKQYYIDKSNPAAGTRLFPFASTGLILSSPVLSLQEGTRTITLRIQLSALQGTITAAILSTLLQVRYSTDKEWIAPSISPVITYTAPELKIYLVLSPTDPPLTVADPKKWKTSYPLKGPMVQILFNQQAQYQLNDPSVNWYDKLSKATWDSVTIDVTADGLKNNLISNDNGQIDASKPFTPFTSVPLVGSNFYIGNEEAFRKPLTSLILSMEWEGLEAVSKFGQYYIAYTPTVDNTSFKVKVDALKNGVWETPADEKGLFSEASDNTLQSVTTLTLTPYHRLLKNEQPLLPFTNTSVEGFVRLKLSPQDFFHQQYPGLLAKTLLALGKPGITATEVAANPLPNLPYTPTLKQLVINYAASVSGTSDISCYHLYPFEEGNGLITIPGGSTLLPVVEDEGTLFIGLTGAMPGAQLALLFQLAVFTANPDLTSGVTPKWEYLVGNTWKPLQKDIHLISDDTKGLLTSGIVTISLPWDADIVHTVLPAGYHWLKVYVNKYTAAVCEGILVAAQAAQVVFTDQGNDPARLSTPLPPKVISSLVVPDSAIKKIVQPYPSFGGRMPEETEDFHTRNSERLRHKGRAINIYDYERIILDIFPDIHKVKCIPHTLFRHNGNDDIVTVKAPGCVTIAVIPKTDNHPLAGKLRPRASSILLNEIREYLQSRTSPFVEVSVVNPIYEGVSFEGNVAFRAGKDAVYYKQELKMAVLRFLSPWAFNGQQDITFGGTIMMSSVLQLIEQQEFVDYVTSFIMYSNRGAPLKKITAGTPWSVLVPDEQLYNALAPETEIVT